MNGMLGKVYVGNKIGKVKIRMKIPLHTAGVLSRPHHHITLRARSRSHVHDIPASLSHTDCNSIITDNA